MFNSKHDAAGIHAAARAVGGCAVYTSDKPGEHDFDLLRRLVFPDGSVPVALRPGRPTVDCLFSDPTGYADPLASTSAPPKVAKTPAAPSALKIWNTNRFGYVVAAFNLRGSAWDRRRRSYQTFESEVAPVTAKISMSDIPAWAPTRAPGSAAVAGVAAAAQFESHFRLPDEVPTDSSSADPVTDPAAAASAAELTPTLEPQLRRAARTAAGAGTGAVGAASGAERMVVAYSHVSGELRLLREGDEVGVELGSRDYEVVTMSEITSLVNPDSHASSSTGSSAQQTASMIELSWAPIGLGNMLNSGGTVLSYKAAVAPASNGPPAPGSRAQASVGLMGGAGEFVGWASEAPVSVTVEFERPDAAGRARAVAFFYDAATGLLKVPVDAPDRQTITVTW
mmetsp:Transcript_37809/g.65168  ORF Transcript_37809/g.65168 Transcript_37809/m.65168 type:complete len:396 (+) Transcript_37809:51-1238(+)